MKKQKDLTDAQHKALDESFFIDRVVGDKIHYTKDFYIVMYKKMEYEKMSAVEAYESMGFDTKLFGKNRAYKAAQRTQKLIKDGQYLINPHNYDGSAPREDFGDLTPEQEAAYYKARSKYLELILEHQKNSIISGSDVLILREREIEIDKFLFVHATLLDNYHHSKENRSTNESIYKLFGVTRQGYHAWLKRQTTKTQKQQAKEELLKKQQAMFKEIIKRLGYVPGKRTFRLEAWRIFNHEISVKRARNVMMSMNLVAKQPKKDPYKNQATHKHVCSAYPNHVNQNFKQAPRTIILTDITYLYYGLNRTPIYLCAFKDAYTSEILGHYVSLSMDTTLIEKAYDMMMKHHGHEFKKDMKVYIHSDQGSQYLSTSFQELLNDDDFIQSMSARGNSYDNAPIESFFSRMKYEVLDTIARATNSTTVKALVDGYMNHYNTKRHQMVLAGLSPQEFYEYKTTGVYPLDNYFGISASKLHTVKEIVEDQEAKEEAKRKKMRERYRKNSQTITPLNVMIKDQNTVRKQIIEWQSKANYALEQVKILKGLKSDINQAIQFYINSQEDIKKQLKNPIIWKNYKEFNYIEKLNHYL